ncbi:MAG: hypothetical protein ACT4OT_04845 [Acidobacteriota bacterium]
MERSSAQTNDLRRILILHITKPIKIDGRLDEPAGPQVEGSDRFPPTGTQRGFTRYEKTEVRLLFDKKNFYIGIHAFDSEASRINARKLVASDRTITCCSTSEIVSIVFDCHKATSLPA